jgi:hypothetical protein
MWYAIKCSYSDWQRNYKRSWPVHSHDAESAFIVDAKSAAVVELHGSGQPRFASVTTGDIGTSGLQVNLPSDPGNNYVQI